MAFVLNTKRYFKEEIEPLKQIIGKKFKIIKFVLPDMALEVLIKNERIENKKGVIVKKFSLYDFKQANQISAI